MKLSVVACVAAVVGGQSIPDGFVDLGCVVEQDAQFFESTDGALWADARENCANLPDLDASIARIDTIEQYNLVLAGVTGTNNWVGFVDPNPDPVRKQGNTTRFIFADGVVNNIDFIHGEAGSSLG